MDESKGGQTIQYSKGHRGPERNKDEPERSGIGPERSKKRMLHDRYGPENVLSCRTTGASENVQC